MNLIATLQLIAQAAAEGNLAVAGVFGLLQGVRELWPKSDPAEVVPNDGDLISIMRTGFAGNMPRNEELQAEILAGNLPEPE